MLGKFDLGQFCNEAQSILQYVGYVVMILKIVIPILIFILGIFDLGRAVIASKEDETKTATKRLLWRLIAGIAIFFLPNLVLWLFGTINWYEKEKGDFETCKTCILSPGQCAVNDGTYK